MPHAGASYFAGHTNSENSANEPAAGCKVFVDVKFS